MDSVPRSIPLLHTGSLLLLLLCGTACERKGGTTHQEDGALSHNSDVVDAGCPHQKDGTCDHQAPDVPLQEAASTRKFGAPLGNSPQVTLEKLISSPAEFHQKTVRIEGHVRKVCERKGCWMEVAEDARPGTPGFRVTFKDYGFLVPVDSKGSNARLEGIVQVTQVKKSAVDHYEAEGASFPSKNADGTAREVRLVATGVELTAS